jgi:thiamine biosynthesis lipoprotein
MTGSIETGQEPKLLRAQFKAMASSCEALIDTTETEVAQRVGLAVSNEAFRIEQKFSRYRADNLVHAINTANGAAVEVDAETADLLDYAARCHELSGGMFDITSGVLRRAWRFDGSDHMPDPKLVEEALKYVGWHKVSWQRPKLRLEPGMEIDFGGIGKEYAVDRAARLGAEAGRVAILVNFGGDLCATGPRSDGSPWNVAIQNPATEGLLPPFKLPQGGVATSGDARRYLIKDGVRYGHILDPRKGWPVQDAPRSVTVVAASCGEAGLLSTLAILQGKGAEAFLKDKNVHHWVMR